MFGNGNWEHKTLGEVGSFKRGGGFQKSDFVERGIPCIHYGQIHTRFGPFIYSHLTDISSDLESKTKFAEKGDLIIAITSEDTEGSCKSTAWLGDYPVAVGGHAAIFHHCMKPVYMSFFFKSALFNYAKREYVHGTKVCEIKPDDIAKIFVPCPPISLQEDFSAIAEQADKSKFMRSKSQFIEMFGDQNTNDKCWSESLVKDEFKLSMGKTPARNNPECWDNGNHKWVSISDMSSYARYTGDTSEYITDYAIADSGIKPVPKGTIIMSFKLSIGRTAITSEDIYTNEAIMAFADFDEKKFNIDFLHFLIANKNWLLGAKQAVKGQTLNKESIGNAKIIIPPIEMQEQFASIYNQADKSKLICLLWKHCHCRDVYTK